MEDWDDEDEANPEVIAEAYEALGGQMEAKVEDAALRTIVG